MLQRFPSFLDVSRSLAGRMRDEAGRQQARRAVGLKGTETRILPVTRSFFEFARPARPRGFGPESTLSNGQDTCFVNIVGRCRQGCVLPLKSRTESIGSGSQLISNSRVNVLPMLKGTENSDRARDQVFLRVRSKCSASAATMGSRPSTGRDTCFVNIIGGE
jgi:hypothetical protein